jgi:hypothetical protein
MHAIPYITRFDARENLKESSSSEEKLTLSGPRRWWLGDVTAELELE